MVQRPRRGAPKVSGPASLALPPAPPGKRGWGNCPAPPPHPTRAGQAAIRRAEDTAASGAALPACAAIAGPGAGASELKLGGMPGPGLPTVPGPPQERRGEPQRWGPSTGRAVTRPPEAPLACGGAVPGGTWWLSPPPVAALPSATRASTVPERNGELRRCMPKAGAEGAEDAREGQVGILVGDGTRPATMTSTLHPLPGVIAGDTTRTPEGREVELEGCGAPPNTGHEASRLAATARTEWPPPPAAVNCTDCAAATKGGTAGPWKVLQDGVLLEAPGDTGTCTTVGVALPTMAGDVGACGALQGSGSIKEVPGDVGAEVGPGL
mmetsp:Transcript_37660/g.117118  ORF Transcript_37660/g.117118 Transcript_37660/m.117118 type:complete len:324 (-) Transcript_37660:1276-2247(-)